MRRTLVLFARAPALGRGKRRLAQDIGEVAAVRFERLMLALLLRRLGRDRRWRLRVAATPDRERRRAMSGKCGIAAVGQGPGDLGRRMRRAIDICPSGPVVLIGADIPALDARHVAAAFRLLGACDLIFGPAWDGGFWLIGVSRLPCPPMLFKNVRWSSPYALADTLAGLPARYRIGFVDRLEDVDDGDAYRRLMARPGF